MAKIILSLPSQNSALSILFMLISIIYLMSIPPKGISLSAINEMFDPAVSLLFHFSKTQRMRQERQIVDNPQARRREYSRITFSVPARIRFYLLPFLTPYRTASSLNLIKPVYALWVLLSSTRNRILSRFHSFCDSFHVFTTFDFFPTVSYGH